MQDLYTFHTGIVQPTSHDIVHHQAMCNYLMGPFYSSLQLIFVVSVLLFNSSLALYPANVFGIC